MKLLIELNDHITVKTKKGFKFGKVIQIDENSVIVQDHYNKPICYTVTLADIEVWDSAEQAALHGRLTPVTR